MKKLLYLLALVAGGVIFTSCNNNSQDEHNPFPWKPVSTTLNTNHEDVGKMCTADGTITEDNNEAEGIIFAVDGNTAYLCAFTDLMTPSRQGRTGLLWELAASSWSSSYDTIPIGTGLYYPVYDSEKGGYYLEKRSEQITDGEVLTSMIVADTTLASSAAMSCYRYFRNRCFTESSDTAQDRIDFGASQGQWYLPSAQELEALLRVKDKINNLYLDGSAATDTVVASTRFVAIGGSMGYAYWSSTEFNNNSAWYRISGTGEQSYFDKTSNGGSVVSKMLVRPIRKVTLQ